DISDMEKTIMYTDWAIGNYFKQVRDKDWAKRTIFIVTADHCFFEPNEPWRTIMETFHVPLLIIGPDIEKGTNDRLANHLNVMPTLIELLKLDTYHASAGVSLFSDRPAVALNNLVGVRTMALNDTSYSTNFENPQPGYYRKDGKWKGINYTKMEKLAKKRGFDMTLKRIYQVCNNARIENRVIGKAFMK
ncbi:MAG: sulfatase-like hydrolase/transferase, partial [Bacteroidota bacterium]